MRVRVLWVPPLEREIKVGEVYDLPDEVALRMLAAKEAELVGEVSVENTVDAYADAGAAAEAAAKAEADAAAKAEADADAAAKAEADAQARKRKPKK